MMLGNFLIVIGIFTLFTSSSSLKFRSNETELLAYQALQAYASLPSLYHFLTKEIEKSIPVESIPNLFAQQQGIEPLENEIQLPNFGALQSWENILQLLQSDPSYRLLILIRHGQAWENLNPTSNENCEFLYHNDTEIMMIPNFDSPLSPDGEIQANNLNHLFQSFSSNITNRTWYEEIGLSQETSMFITSPLTRTLQTTERVFMNLPLSKTSNQSFVVHELIRATLGLDVCNFRHSVKTSTSSNPLPPPWQTGCEVPDESLEEIYGKSSVKFSFPIRPAGGNGFGLISDYDQLWRSDVPDKDVQVTRAKAFLAQIYEYTPASSVTAIVTHGEIIGAIYEAAGEKQGYSAKNTEVVPLMIKFM